MNEMLNRFVNEALSCLIIVPATVLCLLPMKDKMKYSIKNVLPLFLGVLVMVTVIVSGATALLPVDPKVVFYILLVPLFLAYRVIVSQTFFELFGFNFVPCVQGHCRCGYCQMLCNVSAVVYYNELL